MKYPITPEYLETAPDPLVHIFQALEEDVLTDICRRLKVSGELTESAIAQMRVLMQRGYSAEEVEKLVRERLNMAQAEYDAILQRAIERNAEYYDRLVKKTDLLPSAPLDTGIIEAMRRQSLDSFINISQSLGFVVRYNGRREFMPIAKAYQQILSNAVVEVQSGAFSPQQAIRKAVKELAESGINVVDYETGWHNRADVAARRAVMTGVTQLSAQYTEMAADVVKTDLREVSAHRGARDKGTGWQNHKAWQGKVYCMSAGHPQYKDIHEACGLGAVDGLEGANCRHMHYLFVEGVSERTWTDDQLENIDPPPVEFEGKQYSAYEATQMQRKLETAMRTSKRKMIAYEAAGQTEQYTAEAVRLQRLQVKYKEFSRKAGIPMQTERAGVLGFGSDEARAARNAAEEYEAAKATQTLTAAANEQETAENTIRARIRDGTMSLVVNPEKQARHMLGSAPEGRSVMTISMEEIQELVYKYAGTGKLVFDRKTLGKVKEIVDVGKIIGYTVNKDKVIIETTACKIHYSKTGVHVVPHSGGKDGPIKP